MRYRRSSARGFSLQPVPIGGGALANVLQYRRPDVANLFQLLEPTLFRIPRVESNKFWFTLVNVSCTQSGYSYGLCDIPPKAARPSSCTWFFTFALTVARYNSSDVPRHVSLTGINCRAWGNEGVQYVTLGVQHNVAQDFDLKYDEQTVFRVYYLLGALSKQRVLNGRSVQPKVATKDFERLHSRFYMVPLASLMQRTPTAFWPYNRNVWKSAPHLISTEQVDATTLLYNAMYCSPPAKCSKLTEEAAVAVIREAQTSTQFRVASSAPASADSDLLYTALLHRDEVQSVPARERIDLLYQLDQEAVSVEGQLRIVHPVRLFYGVSI